MKSLRLIFPLVALMIVLTAARLNPIAHAGEPSALATAQRQAAQLAPKTQVLQAHFVKAVPYATVGRYTNSVAVGDVNGDGKPDLIVASVCESYNDCPSGGGVSVLLGNGNGTFQAPVAYASGGFFSTSVAVADLNGDGKPDLVVANECATYIDAGCSDNGSLGVLFGNGDGTFQAPVSFLSGGFIALSVAIRDVNHDGHPDLVAANYCQNVNNNCSEGFGPGGVSVLLGDGKGTFTPAVSYSSGGESAESVAIADVNGDGHPDLVVANFCQSLDNCTGAGQVGVLLGIGDGTFQPPVSYASGGHNTNGGGIFVAAGDVNGDGHPDLVVATTCQSSSNCNAGGVNVLLGNGNGTFQAPVAYASGGVNANSLAIADVNGDGHADVVVANRCNSKSCGGVVSVLLGNGDGTLQTAQNFASAGNTAWSVAVADVNGDGMPDLVVANYYASRKNPVNDTVGVLLNSLAKTTTAVTSSLNPSAFGQPVTFTATITSNPSVPDGEVVTFHSGKTNLGTGTTTHGVASLTTSFSKGGTYTIKATYPGDTFHKASSGTVKQVVNP
jgi:hypothetical protein